MHLNCFVLCCRVAAFWVLSLAETARDRSSQAPRDWDQFHHPQLFLHVLGGFVLRSPPLHLVPCTTLSHATLSHFAPTRRADCWVQAQSTSDGLAVLIMVRHHSSLAKARFSGR